MSRKKVTKIVRTAFLLQHPNMIATGNQAI
jgi:hypothetical protein